MEEPKVEVGVLFNPKIEFVLSGNFAMKGREGSEHRQNISFAEGKQTAVYDKGKVLWNGQYFDELRFEPQNPEKDSFELLDVTIGINFHWERKENQRFSGALKLIDRKSTRLNSSHANISYA